MDDAASWVGFTEHTHEATWECVECVVPPMEHMDRFDYLMEFAARDPRKEGIPTTRKLHLRTSHFRVHAEPGFSAYLGLVVRGQLIETDPWNRFVEVYEKEPAATPALA